MQCVGNVPGTSKLATSPQITSLPVGCPACGSGGGGGAPRPRPCPAGAACPAAGACPAIVEATANVTTATRLETRKKRYGLVTPGIMTLTRRLSNSKPQDFCTVSTSRLKVILDSAGGFARVSAHSSVVAGG